MPNQKIIIDVEAKLNESGLDNMANKLRSQVSSIYDKQSKVSSKLGTEIISSLNETITKIDETKKEYRSVLEAFNQGKIDSSKLNEFTKEFDSKVSDLTERVVNLEKSVTDVVKKIGVVSTTTEKFKTQLTSMQGEFNKTVDSIKNAVNILDKFNKMVEVGSKVKGDTSELGDELEQKVSSFKFKNGGIYVPVSLDEKQLPKLQKKYNEIIGLLQKYADDYPVDVTMRLFPLNTTKAGAKEVTDAVKNVQAQIASLPEGELKDSVSALYDNLEQQFQKAVRLKVDVDLGESAASIKARIKDLKDVIQNEAFTIYPKFEIDETESKKVTDLLKKIQEQVTFKATSKIQTMADSLKQVTNTSDVTKWADDFVAGLDAIQNKLNEVVPLMEELRGITSTKKNNIQNALPTEDNVNVLVEFTNAMKSLRQSLEIQQNEKINVDIEPIMEKLDVLRATIAMVHSGIGNLQSTLVNVKNAGGLQVIFTTLQQIEKLINQINSSNKTIDYKVNPDVDVEQFVNEIQSQISQHPISVPITVLDASIDSFINAIQFAIDSRLTNGDIGTDTFLPYNDENIGSDQITSLNRRVGTLKEKIDSTWESWYQFAQAAISSTDISKEGIIGVINKLQELNWALQSISSSNLGFDFTKQIEDINNLSRIADINSNVSVSTTNISAEAKAMEEVYNKALLAAEAKTQFSESNKKVLESIISSLSALNSEGKGFENLNKLINNLSRNKDDRITNMVVNLEMIRDVLSAPVDNTSFIKVIQEIASQENGLENLATALKASKTQLENVKNTLNSTNNSNSDNANLERRIELLNQINKLQIDIYKYKSYGISDNDDRIIDRTIQISQLREELGVLEQVTLTEEQLKTLQQETSKSTQSLRDAEAKAIQSAEKETEQYEKRVLSLKQRLSGMMNNGKLMNYAGEQLESMYDKLNSGAQLTKKELDEIEIGIKTIQTEANKTGNTGKTLLQMLTTRFQSLITYLGSFVSFFRIVSYIRTAITTIKDLDTQLVDLRKTTTMTTSELNGFYNASSDIAKQLGVTTSEIISQAAAWSRLGYSSQEAATQMAELSSKFTSISPGMTTDNATDYLVSTMQAYGIAVDDVERKIMDNVNRIGNTFATTNAEIGEMLTRSSAAMKAANNTLEETIALESAAVQITRNAETTGTAFRTISMRIRGYDEETEELSKDLENISGDIYDLTKVDGGKGISIFTDENRDTYKSTYEILKDISEVWDDLTDKQQADLLEKLGGKRGAQTIAGILADFSEVDRAMDEMENAAGSADKEMDIIRDSIEFKINTLKQTWVGILQEAINRDSFKNIIDALTDISEAIGKVTSNIGILKTAIIGISGIIGSQKLG